MLKYQKRAAAAVGAATLALSLAACGGGDEGGEGSVSGSVTVDGSSTVYPMSVAAQELVNEEHPSVKVSVAESGTGGGFEKFCAGETDISDASRPIKDEEKTACESGSIDYTELHVATDALTVAVHPDLAVDCLTVDQLVALFGPKATATNWNQIDPSFPDQKISLYIPGTDSGTYDYMAADVVGDDSETLRSDVESSEDDNILVQGISGTKGAVGFFGYSYYEENQDSLKALQIDSGDGCIAPSADTARDGTYTPLARPLFIYVKNASYTDSEATKAYVDFYIDNLPSIAEAAQFIPLSDEDYTSTKDALAGIGG
ncbi:PstS family phosphate ABC transporter substrate-binding protein [Pimelobacter simplex]|uniref:Phosphate-binding protein n=1 Tax=Nocardioides simplex TaxID=2045 RepID=A0A7J5DYH8_NOCSI|nr:PstS family phosphate ABC transporter substrate-binding protein [Pimelobacter simplex]KAB2810977.1 PstS family phosphate ABC transporter substrate-binding protein [Pimelobacter simplex]